MREITMRIFFNAVVCLIALPAATALASVETYYYDARGQLKISCQTPQWSMANKTVYSLDKAGNRTNVTASNQVVTIAAGSNLSSVDGRFHLTMQTDGNFVLYGPSGVLWQAATTGSTAEVAIFQTDGNLVLYSATAGGVWATNTNSYCANLVVQNDGNVVIFSPTGSIIWQTNTGGH